LSFKDDYGGAFIGAKRLHHALRNRDVDSTMLVRRKVSDEPSILQYKAKTRLHQEKFNKWVASKMPEWREALPGTLSFNLRYTGVHQIINNSDADCVIMHWIGHDTISIKEIGLIKKPIIWRLADMWAFDGCRHYCSEEEHREVDSLSEKKGSINNLIWKRKKRHWQTSRFNIVCGSDWLANKAKRSLLFRNSNVLTIPSSLDTEIFRPILQRRVITAKDSNSCSILFGAHCALSDKRKGFDLLVESLVELRSMNPRLKFDLRVFGHSKAETLYVRGIKFECLGFIKCETEMAKIYNRSDLFVIPSRADNLPFTAMESLSCGKPVVGFGVGGIPEIIDHKKNGYIAPPFDCVEFARGINWIYKKLISDGSYFNVKARKKATDKYSFDAQAQSYIKLIKAITQGNS